MKTSVAILFVLFGALYAPAQEPTPTPTVVGKERTKGEVDLAVEEFKSVANQSSLFVPANARNQKI